MAIIKINEFKTNSNKNVTRKELVLKCDWCEETFERKSNVPRAMKNTIHFCSNSCSAKHKMKYNSNCKNSINNFYIYHQKLKNDKNFSKKVKEKRKQTNLKKYGVEYSLQSSEIKKKTKQTNIKKYGFDNPVKNNKIKEKIQKTNLERYGSVSPFGSKDIQDKSKNTIKERYKVDHQMLSSKVVKKFKTTNLKKYGVDNPLKNTHIKEKIKQKNLEKYGVEFPLQSKEIYNKTTVTLNERHGINSPFQLPNVKEKIKQTSLKRYGLECPLSSEKSRSKAKQTRFRKYGVEYTFQLNSKNIIENNEDLLSWWNKLPSPKPGYSTLCRHFTQKNITLSELNKYIDDYKDNKTSLEVATEQLLEINHYNKKPKEIQKIYRPDFKLVPNIFLNVDGLYWHSETCKDKKYHFELRKEFEDSKLRIFQFREDEIRSKTDIVKSIIDNSLGKTKNKVFARKCEVKKIKHAKAIEFLNDNHLMGPTSAKNIGLTYNNKLVSILSYKCKGHVCKIERFCSLNNHVVIGGFSKLLKHLEQNILKPDITEIHNWVDLRYGTGYHLENKGFKLIKDTLGWKWTNGIDSFNRLKCKANMDERNLTQQEYADELGWYKIYDAGQRLYVKYL